MKFDSTFFEKILTESIEDIKPQDITESIHFDINDDKITSDNCKLIAYNIHVDEDDNAVAYNPKKNPDKAIDIMLDYPEHNMKIEIFLDTKSQEWDSLINNQNRLSPEQMEQFFKTNFFNKVKNRLHEMWTDEDPLFKKLLEALDNKKIKIGDVIKDDSEIIDEEDGKNKFGTGKIDAKKSREKNAAGKQIRSRSGRKYIQPSDFSVKHDDNEGYFCWPSSKGRGDEPEFRWSQWADWKKIKPLCRMRWSMGTVNSHVYGLTISPMEELNTNRGFRSYDLTAQPPLQYLTPEETDMIMDLSIVRKFLQNATKRIEKYLNYDDEEIFKRINKPDKCSIEDIRKTKRAIRNALDAIKNRRADNYIYTD